MTSKCTFVCPVVNGLHARPATQLAEVAKRFPADVTLTNERTGTGVNAKSILAIVSADVRLNDPCRLDVSGDRAAAALAALREFVNDTLPNCANEPIDEPNATAVALPRSFLETGACWKAGTPVSRGIGRGAVISVVRLGLPDRIADVPAGEPDEELARLVAALAGVRAHISAQRTTCPTDARNEIITAHLAIVDDVDLLAQTEEHIRSGCSAAQAVASAARSFAERLRVADSTYIRERAIDIEDIGVQILEVLCGGTSSDAKIELSVPSVIVAENLTPRQLLSADRGLIRALILEHTGATAHVVIMARSLGIPTLAGVTNVRASFAVGDDVIVDAHLGVAIRNPQPAVTRYYTQELSKHRRRQKQLMSIAKGDAVTRDGWGIEVGINAGLVDDIDPDFLERADGIGLLRTEMAFSNRETAPTEDEQYEVYARAVVMTKGKPVIIRMFDVGADKPLPYLRLPAEQNPFLGCRGVRNYARHPDLIRAQLRAILRASAVGPVRLMVPMVSCFEEVARIHSQVSEVRQELDRADIPFDRAMQVGIMVEVPLITLALDEVCGIVDFLSIGTNDLAQYFAAADRCNPAVASLGDVRHPAFLRVVASIVRIAHRHGRWVGLCGDMASDVRNLPLLLGLGLDEISVIATEAPHIKASVGRYSVESCRALLETALSCRTATDVEQLLDGQPSAGATDDLLSPELIVDDLDCSSQAEAIKAMVDELFVTGRTDEPERVEKAIWAREEAGPSGLGHGFAIPHCKSDAVGTSSVAVARLRTPIEWNSIDGALVECVILLAMNESDQQDTHMRVFSGLARRLMHEDFRESLLTAADSGALHTFLIAELEPGTRDGTVS